MTVLCLTRLVDHVGPVPPDFAPEAGVVDVAFSESNMPTGLCVIIHTGRWLTGRVTPLRKNSSELARYISSGPSGCVVRRQGRRWAVRTQWSTSARRHSRARGLSITGAGNVPRRHSVAAVPEFFHPSSAAISPEDMSSSTSTSGIGVHR